MFSVAGSQLFHRPIRGTGRSFFGSADIIGWGRVDLWLERFIAGRILFRLGVIFQGGSAMKYLLMVLGFAVVSVSVCAGEVVKLPEPRKTGGLGVLEAIDMRSSAGQGDFPKGKLSPEDLGTLLWAATGRNRDGSKWTVPMAMGRPPYTKVYVTDREGVYLYDWENHALEVISRDAKVHASLPVQAFAKAAPVGMFMVPDMGQLSSNSYGEEWGVLLAGAMSQNVYLAAEALGVGARLVYSIERERAREAFGLSGEDTPLFSIVLGKR